MKIFDKMRRFLSHTGGNVAVIFSLALGPIAILSGGAVDVSQAMNSRARLAEAMDAAALAVGGQTNLNDAQATQVAWDYINANYPEREIGTVQSINVHINRDDGVVTVTGQSSVQTTLLGLMGMESIDVNWVSEVRQSRQALELAMVLDNTGSMGGSKIRALRDAALLLTDVLYSNGDPDRLSISLVPFAATVNVGREFERVWWLDPDGESPVHAEWAGEGQDVTTCTGRGRRRVCTTETIQAINWDLFDSLRNTSWEGCVEARMLPLDIEDVAADASRPETLFVPYFAPDEPDISNYSNNYLDDDLLSSLVGGIFERLQYLPKYDNARPSFNGPNAACTVTPITPLTATRSRIDSAISDMEASGNTNIANGVGWGVRVLSPQMPFTEGVSYDDRDVNVLNGQNTAFMSRYEAYGYINDDRLGIRTSSSSRLSDALDERTAAACAYAKSQGIRVYTISFQVSSNSTRNMMESCASSPSLYFDSPSSSALRDAFEMIAGDLANLRLAR